MKSLLSLAACLALAACHSRSASVASKAAVDAAAASHDPATLELSGFAKDQLKSTSLPAGIQAGIITLGDGEQVKFWFQSHHLGRDFGCTRFQYRDGTVNHLRGYFCCEVMLPDDPLAERAELQQFIAANDGREP